MIGSIIIIIAGWTIRKLWPTGVLFLLIFAALSTAIGLFTREGNLEALGETVSYDAPTITLAYGSTLLIHTIIFLVAFGLCKQFSKKRKHLDVKERADGEGGQ